MEQIARTPKQIGEIIRRSRRHKDITQGTLGGKAGLRQATISQIETGNPAAKLGTICDLLAALDLELVIRPRSKGSAKDIEDLF